MMRTSFVSGGKYVAATNYIIPNLCLNCFLIKQLHLNYFVSILNSYQPCCVTNLLKPALIVIVQCTPAFHLTIKMGEAQTAHVHRMAVNSDIIRFAQPGWQEIGQLQMVFSCFAHSATNYHSTWTTGQPRSFLWVQHTRYLARYNFVPFI